MVEEIFKDIAGETFEGKEVNLEWLEEELISTTSSSPMPRTLNEKTFRQNKLKGECDERSQPIGHFGFKGESVS